MIRDLILKNRSYRRFYENTAVKLDLLKDLVDLARLSPSAANLQPLKYLLSNTPKKNSLIFSRLAWAGYLKDWTGPKEGERPAAYIIILGDTEITKNFGCDQGIAAQSILLGAVEKDLGGCILGSIDRDGLRNDLHIPGRYEILLVLALGKPKEKIMLDVLKSDNDIKYWRDDKNLHHVPKRKLEDIILSL